MGQKVSPVGLRVGVIRDWDSRWYAEKNQVADLLQEDIKIRLFLEGFYKNASVSRIEIERLQNAKKEDRVRITINTAKPGMVIGKDEELKNQAVAKLQKMTKKEIILNVLEIKQPELDANLVAKSIAEKLEGRASFRRVQKIAIQQALRAGAKGARTLISGRLGGAEMARSEGYSEGQVPLHTLRANVDYAVAEADTTYGKMGIKVWIYKGEVLNRKAPLQAEKTERPERPARKPQAKKDANGGK